MRIQSGTDKRRVSQPEKPVRRKAKPRAAGKSRSRTKLAA
jgi:hypothetical protein